MEFNNKQQHQENAYALPYHWLINDEYDRRGRMYFGYIDFCADIALKSEGPILDAGCGDGRFLGRLVEKKYSGEMHGVDYSERAIEMAKLFVPEAQFVCAGASSLPYVDSFFKHIFLIETLEHISPEGIPVILGELRRVLKDNGHIVITVPSVSWGIPPEDSKHYQHFSPKSLTECLLSEFEVEELYGQAEIGINPLKFIDRMVDNKLVVIKPLRRLYVDKIWKKFFNICNPKKGRRLIAVCKRK